MLPLLPSVLFTAAFGAVASVSGPWHFAAFALLLGVLLLMIYRRR